MASNRFASSQQTRSGLKGNFDLAFSALRSKKYEEALVQFKKIKETSDSKAVDLHIARCYLCMKKYDEAKSSLEAAEKTIKHEDDKSLWNDFYITYSRYHREQFERSQDRAHFDLAIKYLSRAPLQKEKKAQLAFAVCYYSIKNYEQALIYVEAVLKSHSKDKDAEKLKSMIICKISPREAKSINSQQIATNVVHDVTYYATRAALLEKQGHLHDAEAHFKEGVEKFPTEWQLKISYATFLEKISEDYKAAFKMAKKVLDFDVHLPKHQHPSNKQMAEAYNILAISVDNSSELSDQTPSYFINKGLKYVPQHQALMSLKAKLVPFSQVDKWNGIYNEAKEAHPEEWNTRHGVKNIAVNADKPSTPSILQQASSPTVSDSKKRRDRRNKKAQPQQDGESLNVLHLQKTQKPKSQKKISDEVVADSVPKKESSEVELDTSQKMQVDASKATQSLKKRKRKKAKPNVSHANMCRKFGLFALTVVTTITAGYVFCQHNNINP